MRDWFPSVMSTERTDLMGDLIPEPPGLRGDELQLKGLIYVRALRAAGGAPRAELQQFTAEIKRQRRLLAADRCSSA